MEDWKQIARDEQKNALEIFGCTDWDVFRPEECRLLYDKIALAIFGPPHIEYDRNQLASIRKVTDAILRESEVIDGGWWMSIVVVVVKPPKVDHYCHPVFRVPKQSDKRHTFIDSLGRVYGSWKAFLEDNMLPLESDICYPEDGVYRQDAFGQPMLEFGRTKSGTLSKVADGVNNMVALSSIGVAVTALALPVAAPAVAAAAVGSVVCGVYGAATAALDQVDRKLHGQSIGLTELQSTLNWATMATGFMGIWPGVKCLQSRTALTKSEIFEWAKSAASALKMSGVSRETLRNVGGKAVSVQQLPYYALVFGHVVADVRFVTHFMSNEQRTDALYVKSLLINQTGQGETLRYLEFVGFERGKLPDILKSGLSDPSCQISLSFACNREMFDHVKAHVSHCMSWVLERGSEIFANISVDKETALRFVSEHDFTWIIEISSRIAWELKCKKGEALLGVMATFYNYMRKVIDMALSRPINSFPRLNFTPDDVVNVAKMCMNRNCNFSEKLGILCKDFLLPRLKDLAVMVPSFYLQQNCTHPSITHNFNSVSEKEIFKAAGDLVGVPLDRSKAKITRGGDEIFVIILDSSIPFSVLEVRETRKFIANVIR